MFDSKKEASRYQDLKILQAGGVVTGLEIQPRFDLTVNGQKVCRYRADFRYKEHGKTIVEDCKGVRTRDYVIKRKLMKAIYGIEVVET